MSNVTFLVDHMTDWQIWFSAFIVKYLKSTPDVDVSQINLSIPRTLPKRRDTC